MAGIFEKLRHLACRHPLLLWLPLLSVLIFSLKSCAPKVGDVEVPVEEPTPFSETGTAIIPDRWWRSFDDPELNAVVDTALAENLGLAGNWQEFRAALASVRYESSFLWPEIGASAGASTERPQSEFTGGEDYSAGLSASYELDLWGRIRAGIQAEEFRAQATYYDYQSAAMTLSAETSITWYQLATAKKQLALINEQIETNEDIVRLIRARFAGGQIRAVDILRQQQLLESTREEKIFYETQVGLLRNELAVLMGKPPQNELEVSADSLPEMPPLPEVGLPLELIRRRPDVQQAYNLVLAADREMAEAIRSKYPRLSLNIGAFAFSNNSANLFQDWAYSLAGDLVAPLLYGGRFRADVDRTEALKRQQLYIYGQVVLNAFQEVEDALLREEKLRERLEILERRLELSRKTNGQLRIEFLNGLSDYLDVLLSLDQEQALQREFISAQQELLESRISLYRALAGGFDPERPEMEE